MPPTHSRRLNGTSLLLAVAVVGWSPGAEAQHASVWKRAKKPQTALQARAWHQSELAMRRLPSRRLRSESTRQALRRGALRKAQAMLELSGASTSPNPQLRYQLATVYRRLANIDNDTRLFERALPLLDFVIQHTRATQLRADALFDKAVSLARLGRPGEELAPYQRAIQIEPRQLRTTVLFANLAEAYMLKGQLGRAIEGYRASLDLIPTVAYRVMAPATLWGLAVALDRSGDLEAGLARVAEARLYDPSDIGLNNGNWFFLPAYDRHWYQALGHWLDARKSSKPLRKKKQWAAASRELRLYISAAKTGDRYRRLAQARLLQVESERRAALTKNSKASTKTKAKMP